MNEKELIIDYLNQIEENFSSIFDEDYSTILSLAKQYKASQLQEQAEQVARNFAIQIQKLTEE